jgi:signal transduction histidine kinase
MVEQNLPLQGPMAPEVAAALVDLAQLAQHAGSATIDALGLVADKMLVRLLALCAAQRGAVLLGIDEGGPSEQHSSLSTSYPKTFRALALHGVGEEEAHTFLTTFPSSAADVQSGPDMTCWITYKLSIGDFMVESEQPYEQILSPYETMTAPFDEMSPTSIRQPLHAILVIGWAIEDDNECALAVERGHHLLPFVADAAGAVIVNILLVERIHELQASRIRDALREMKLLKAELLGTVSHELRSPLASIKGYAGTLLRHERRISREERHQFLLAINEASDRLEIIIERLLEMSQLETGAITIHRSPVDLARLANEAITAIDERVSEQFPGRFAFKLSLEHADGAPAHSVPLILADPRRMREVLDNLLENAVKYSPAGGMIKVIIHPVTQVRPALMEASRLNQDKADVQQLMHIPRQMLEVLVCDNGIGIAVEHLERIFDRFHRVDTRLTREVNGLGLGLAICKSIVEMHDGFIWAENKANGKGSIFHLRLPLDEIPNV